MSRSTRASHPPPIEIHTIALPQFLLDRYTAYRLARNGEVPFVRIGKKAIRFDLEQVREALTAPAPSFKRSPWPFVRLDDLQVTREWLKPPADVVLKRFNVPFPTKDLTRLAYDRTAL